MRLRRTAKPWVALAPLAIDWVIKSFELARKHFPKAKLLLNEYNVIVENGITTNYLGLINLLHERKLIDGIGEQAHFYERASPEVLGANLDRLAAVGLPIYISEFDLNLANDADQANVMKKLFPIFWDHPQVAGVTHWGHQQGSVWRVNAYLIRSDGTTRPALDWINCYRDGGGDTCTVPVYVPPGWQGDEFGITLEAINHDEGQGVVSGGVIAYTDDGDWIAFQDVAFESDWDTVWVTYAKGNTTAGSVSVHLDSLANPALVTVDLPPTSGWGSSATVDEALSSVTGTHDVYIRFNGAPGVANLSSVRFGKPVPPSGINLRHQWRLRGGYRRLEQLGQWHAERQHPASPQRRAEPAIDGARRHRRLCGLLTDQRRAARYHVSPSAPGCCTRVQRPTRGAWWPRWNAPRPRRLPATTPFRGCRTMARWHRTPGRSCRAISSFRTATSSTWLSTSRARPRGSMCTWMT